MLKLSDAFETPSENLELIAHVYNLADGKSQKLKDKCQSLLEYSIFSNRYKFYRKQNLSIDEAVHKSVHYCLEHNVMTEYLKNHQEEVIDMFGFEWNEQEAREALLKAGEARGEAQGEARGKFAGKLEAIKSLMKSTNWSAEAAMKALDIAPADYKKYLMML